MIISHKHRFIFIKTRKTAGTSIELFLSRHAGENAVVTPIIPPVEPHRPRNHAGFYNHIPVGGVRKLVGDDVWHNYYRFCIERNPWDKTLSHYHMLNSQQGGTLTFDHYLQAGDWCLNYPQYTVPGDPGTLMVHRVLRYESLNDELADVFARLGIPFGGTLNERAKAEYRADRRPYREVYTPAQAQRVERAFAVECGLFGYCFA